MISVSESVRLDEDEYELSYSRSSGPGGQNVNKVNSKVTLRWAVAESRNIPPDVIARFRSKNANRISNDGYFVIQSDRYRDQIRNAQDCRDKLARLLREALTPPVQRKKTKPSRAQAQQRLDEKKQQSEKKKSRRWRPGGD